MTLNRFITGLAEARVIFCMGLAVLQKDDEHFSVIHHALCARASPSMHA